MIYVIIGLVVLILLLAIACKVLFVAGCAKGFGDCYKLVVNGEITRYIRNEE